MRRRFDFVACDLDGTLLTPQHVLGARTRRTLRALARSTQPAPPTLILATGRAYADVRVLATRLQDDLREHGTDTPALRSSQLQTPPPLLPAMYLITSNGAVVHNVQTGACVAGHYLDEDTVRALYAFVPASETRINVNIYQREHWYARYDWPQMLVYHSESGVTYRVLAELPSSSHASAATAHDTDGVKAGERSAAQGDLSDISVVFFCAADTTLLLTLEQQLRQRFGDAVAISMSTALCLDVVARGVNKATGLRDVFATLPPQPHEQTQRSQQHDTAATTGAAAGDLQALVADRLRRSVAFGDGMNDVEMLQAVGKGCIMANANPRLKAALPHLEVIGSNDDDAVARKLQELFDLPDE